MRETEEGREPDRDGSRCLKGEFHVKNISKGLPTKNFCRNLQKFFVGRALSQKIRRAYFHLHGRRSLEMTVGVR
jgi:hypothetical protein